MTAPDPFGKPGQDLLVAEQVSVFADAADQQVERIRRIGKRLFNVASCVVILNGKSHQDAESKIPTRSEEEAFCQTLPTPNALTVVPNARLDPMLRQQRAVMHMPGIRFYAAYPVCDSDQTVIGSVSLIDYSPRNFSGDDEQLLIDLAMMVERELHVRSLNALQLDLQKKNKNLRRKSLIDPLIGTWNRGAIMRILTIEAVRCDKMGIPLSIIVADLDYFKKINDTYGHPAGDTVLVKVASRLRSCIRPQEALGRYGGEEFLVVLPGASHTTALAVAERMRMAVASQSEMIGDATFNLTISAGVASTDLFPSATTDELISHADIALYAAKNAGRDCVVQATPVSS